MYNVPFSNAAAVSWEQGMLVSVHIFGQNLHNPTSKGCLLLCGIFRAQRNFSLFVSFQAELIEKKKKNCAALGKFRPMENSLKAT